MPRYGVYGWLNLFSLAFAISMFVLLLLLMCILPLSDAPIIATPFSLTGDKSPETEYDLNVALRADGRIVVRERQISRRELVKIIVAARSDAEVRILAETGTPFRYIRGVTAAARDAGRTRIIFLVRPADRTDSRKLSAVSTGPSTGPKGSRA